jgi:hypothetical protein
MFIDDVIDEFPTLVRTCPVTDKEAIKMQRTVNMEYVKEDNEKKRQMMLSREALKKRRDNK